MQGRGIADGYICPLTNGVDAWHTLRDSQQPDGRPMIGRSRCGPHQTVLHQTQCQSQHKAHARFCITIETSIVGTMNRTTRRTVTVNKRHSPRVKELQGKDVSHQDESNPNEASMIDNHLPLGHDGQPVWKRCARRESQTPIGQIMLNILLCTDNRHLNSSRRLTFSGEDTFADFSSIFQCGKSERDQ